MWTPYQCVILNTENTFKDQTIYGHVTNMGREEEDAKPKQIRFFFCPSRSFKSQST